jgi:type IX secretion system PorP/SprF family membrane protein
MFTAQSFLSSKFSTLNFKLSTLSFQLFAFSFLLSALSLPDCAYAQDPQFSQYYAAPLYLNPAFAGATHESRAMFNNRYQWVNLPKPFITYAASIDHNFEKFRSGVGLMAMLDKAGAGALKSASINGMYSFRVNLSSKLVFRPGIQFGYVSRSIDYYNLTFGSQIDGVPGIPYNVAGKSSSINYFDFGAGFLFYNNKFWMGMASSHINQPDQSLNTGGNKLPIKTTVHGGIKFFLKEGVHKKKYGEQKERSISPTFVYKHQENFDQLDLGLYVCYEPVVTGLWYRGIPFKRYNQENFNHDAVVVMVGVRTDRWGLGYSYDLTISSLTATKTAGAHEFSLSYVFKTRKIIRRKDMVIPCPKF